MNYNKGKKQRPVVDTSTCNLCGGCIEMCPEVFSLNEIGGYVEVEDIEEYPVKDINDAINMCPQDSISWEE